MPQHIFNAERGGTTKGRFISLAATLSRLGTVKFRGDTVDFLRALTRSSLTLNSEATEFVGRSSNGAIGLNNLPPSAADLSLSLSLAALTHSRKRPEINPRASERAGMQKRRWFCVWSPSIPLGAGDTKIDSEIHAGFCNKIN